MSELVALQPWLPEDSIFFSEMIAISRALTRHLGRAAIGSGALFLIPLRRAENLRARKEPCVAMAGRSFGGGPAPPQGQLGDVAIGNAGCETDFPVQLAQ